MINEKAVNHIFAVQPLMDSVLIKDEQICSGKILKTFNDDHFY